MIGSRRRFRIAIAACLIVVCIAGASRADIVCPDSSYVRVVFNRTYPIDSQFAGEPYDYVTVTPDGSGETFTDVNGIDEGDGLRDIDIRVYVRNCQGLPIEGLPAQEISLWGAGLCICPYGSNADLLTNEPDGAGTDANGIATFTGTIRAGGCTPSLGVYIQGILIDTLADEAGRTVKINSTDAAHLLTSPCFTDASDLGWFARHFTEDASGPGGQGFGNICVDFNERGATIDASDLASFASALGAACQ